MPGQDTLSCLDKIRSRAWTRYALVPGQDTLSCLDKIRSRAWTRYALVPGQEALGLICELHAEHNYSNNYTMVQTYYGRTALLSVGQTILKRGLNIL